MVYLHEPIFGKKMYSRLIADTEEELLEVGELLGLQQGWVKPGHVPHFEIYSTKLRLAMRHDRITYLSLAEFEEIASR
jgi:hypothetical protein